MKEIILINHLMEAINDQNNDKNQGLLNVSSPFYQSRVLFENEYETNHDYSYVDRKTYCFNTDTSLNFINSPIDDSFVEASTNACHPILKASVKRAIKGILTMILR